MLSYFDIFFYNLIFICKILKTILNFLFLWNCRIAYVPEIPAFLTPLTPK